jgi:hypothetical protein
VTGVFSADDLAEFRRFAGGPTLQLPATMQTEPLRDRARRLEKLEVAIYFFTVPGPRKTTLQGRLAVIPRKRVAPRELPLASSFLGGPTSYYQGGYCVSSWVEGQFVYVCCLRGVEADLHRLLPKRQMT